MFRINKSYTTQNCLNVTCRSTYPYKENSPNKKNKQVLRKSSQHLASVDEREADTAQPIWTSQSPGNIKRSQHKITVTHVNQGCPKPYISRTQLLFNNGARFVMIIALTLPILSTVFNHVWVPMINKRKCLIMYLCFNYLGTIQFIYKDLKKAINNCLISCPTFINLHNVAEKLNVFTYK